MNQNKNNSQQISLNSVAGMLKMIYDETLTTNVLLGDIKNFFTKNKGASASLALSSFGNQAMIHTNIHQQQVQYRKKHIQILESIQSFLIETVDYFKELLTPNNQSVNNQQSADKFSSSKITGFVGSLIKQQNVVEAVQHSFQTLFQVVLEQVNLLQSLLTTTTKIYNYLPKLGGGSNQSLSGTNSQFTDEFASFGKTIQTIRKSLTKHFIELFDTFVETYLKFIDERNTKKMMMVSVQLNTFAYTIRVAGFWLNQARIMFTGLVKSIIILSLVLISPMFILGISILVGAIKTLRKTLGSDNNPNDAINLLITRSGRLTFALIQLATAFWIVSAIPFDSVIKFGAILLMLIGISKLMNIGGNQTSIKKEYSLSGFFGLAAGLSLLVLTLSATNEINWAGAGFVIIFLTTLMVTLRSYSGGMNNKNSLNSLLLKIASGLALLILSIDAVNELNPTGALFIIGFILALGTAVRIANKVMGSGTSKSSNSSFHTSGIFGLGAGLALLILSIAAVDEINTSNALWLIGFILAVGVAVSLPALFGKQRGSNMSGIFGFAAGVGLLILAVAATEELNWKPASNLLLFITGLSLTIGLFQRVVKSDTRLIKQGFNIGLFVTMMTGTIWLVDKIIRGTEASNIVLFGLHTLSFALLIGVIDTFKTKIISGLTIFKSMSLGLLMMAGVMFLISKSNIDWLTLAQFGLTIVSTSAIVFGLGILNTSGLITSGAIALVTMGVGLLLASISFNIISKTNIKWEQLGQFAAGVGSLIMLCFGLSFISIPVLLGAGALVILGAATVLIATGLFLVSLLRFDTTNVESFAQSITILCEAYNNIGWSVAGAVLVSTSLMFVITTTFLSAIAFQILTTMKYHPDRIKQYGISVKELIGAYDDIGLWSVTKAGIKSLALLPILGTSFLSAIVFKKIGELNLSKNTMSNFGSIMDEFLTVTTDSVNKAIPSLKAVEPGLEAFSKLVSSCSSLVDVIESFANMKIGVWELDKNSGQLKLVSYKQIDDNMMTRVGSGIGKIIQALLQPMSVMSSDDKRWNFGNGVVIDNPFVRSNKVSQFFLGDKTSGRNRIQQIGDAYLSLSNVMANVAEIELLTGDEQRYNTFKKTFTDFIKTLVESLTYLEPVNPTKITNQCSGLFVFVEALKRLQNSLLNGLDNQKTNITHVLKDMMNTLADSNKWNNINRNLEKTAKNINSVVSNINKIDINKATALERNLRLMSETKTLDGIKEVIENLKELIGMLQEHQEKQSVTNERLVNTLSEQNQSNSVPFVEKIGSKVVDGKSTKVQRDEENQQLIANMTETLNNYLNQINQKLGNTLRVQIVNSVNILS